MLHGRAAELGDIHELLANARVGHSSMLVLQGEAGSGKSALLEHVATDAKELAGANHDSRISDPIVASRAEEPPAGDDDVALLSR